MALALAVFCIMVADLDRSTHFYRDALGFVEGATRQPNDGAAGVDGQTPIFHAATQFYDYGLPVAEFLVEKGADLSLRVMLPGHYERPEEFVECTALEYARLFPGNGNQTVAFLSGAVTAE